MLPAGTRHDVARLSRRRPLSVSPVVVLHYMVETDAKAFITLDISTIFMLSRGTVLVYINVLILFTFLGAK